MPKLSSPAVSARPSGATCCRSRLRPSRPSFTAGLRLGLQGRLRRRLLRLQRELFVQRLLGSENLGLQVERSSLVRVVDLRGGIAKDGGGSGGAQSFTFGSYSMCRYTWTILAVFLAATRQEKPHPRKHWGLKSPKKDHAEFFDDANLRICSMDLSHDMYMTRKNFHNSAWQRSSSSSSGSDSDNGSGIPPMGNHAHEAINQRFPGAMCERTQHSILSEQDPVGTRTHPEVLIISLCADARRHHDAQQPPSKRRPQRVFDACSTGGIDASARGIVDGCIMDAAASNKAGAVRRR